MKRSIILGLIVILIGIALTVVGMFINNDTNGADVYRYVQRSAYGSTYHKQLSPFHNINVNIRAAVTIQHGSNNHFQITGYDAQHHRVHYHVQNDQLTISDKNSTNKRGFRISGLGIASYDAKITITLPQNVQLKQYQQKYNEGGLTVKGVNIQKALYLPNADFINLQSVKGHSINLKTSFGDLTINNCKFDKSSSKINANTSDIDINNSQFKSLNASSVNGDITVKNTLVKSQLNHISSTYGDIDLLSGNHFDSLLLNNVNGDVTFQNPTIHHHFKIQTSNGDIHGQLSANDMAHISADSNNGDIHIARPLNHLNAKKQYEFYTHNGDINITKGY